MQRKIELLEKISENALFHIDEFSFQLTVEDKGNMRKYFMELKVAGQSPSDVRFFLEEVAPEWEFLLESPKELTDYIKSYEEDNNPNDESLFHDLRTKYVEFLKRRESDSFDATERIIILGFSVVEEKIYMVLKTFSLNVLSTFLEKLKQYCRENEMEIVMSEDVRWIELNQYVVRQKEVVRGLQSEEFLKRTVVKKLFPRFLRIFKFIDMDGYFEKGIYDEVMFQKEAYPNGSVKKVEIRQVSRFFSSYWKYRLSAKDKEILCLHDEKPDDKGIEKYVYTFKPSLFIKDVFENW